MRIKSLNLINFGPFRTYEVPFVEDEHSCMLLTGKNNEGKSTIILALKLISSALRSIGNRKQYTVIGDSAYYRLPQADIVDINIGRMLHNYIGTEARIEAILDDGFEFSVILDDSYDLIYADFIGTRVPHDTQQILGFIPPLGPLAEKEEFLTNRHIRANLNTSLAPRHLRNHFKQILTEDEYKMVQALIRDSWSPIQLLDYEYHAEDNSLYCYFKEGRIEREIAWAGQGLQIWFQIVTHLVRLRQHKILVLDEPEINLHPEKQNELIRILTEYHTGSVLIATHSVELMNNVNVSHIVHVQKKDYKPIVKTTADRIALELVRSRIGSNFNLIASQFENCDLILFTEDTSDFSIIEQIASEFGLSHHVFNIPIHGFSEYKKALSYKNAYRLLIGRDTAHSILLDRDYYPEKYLQLVHDDLNREGIRTLFTPGKEIENIYLHPLVLKKLIPNQFFKEFNIYWENIIQQMRLDCFGSYLTLHHNFLHPKIDHKTVTKLYSPFFEACWKDNISRHLIISGKDALHHLRGFYRNKIGHNLTQKDLIKAVVKSDDGTIRSLIEQIYYIKNYKKQILHY